MFFATPRKQEEVASNVDQFGDSYARNTTSEELGDVRFPHNLSLNHC
jgi:DNA ligase-4